MSCDQLPPPAATCLIRRSPSTQKGGTLIAEDATNLEIHRRKLCDPDGYRPAHCRRCGHSGLHIHDYPERQLHSDEGSGVIRVVRHRCVGCGAIWRILPAFLARFLRCVWSFIEQTLAVPPLAAHGPSPVSPSLPAPPPSPALPPPPPSPVPAPSVPAAPAPSHLPCASGLSPRTAPPASTVRRWRARMAMSAALLCQVLAGSGSPDLERLVHQARLSARRADLVAAYVVQQAPPSGQALSNLAALLHRLAPGVRLM